MKLRLLSKRIIFVFTVIISIAGIAAGQVNNNASAEARALLKYFQNISGKYVLTGQHNFPSAGERNTRFAADYIGKTPVVWSQDFGFAAAGDKDSYLARPDIIKEAIKQHKKGAVIALCWHAVPPTAEEPVTFQPLPGADPDAPPASVQGKLTDKQFRDILTPGTRLYKNWERQVDEIASFLKQLQDAKVPVLWRPYHEMNGDWFWWGGRHEGKYTTAALYRQIFDRMVKIHKLNNLVWVWSVDRPSKPGMEFANYFPGSNYADILAIDIYGNDFNQSYYDGLMALSEGKPVTLGEVGNPPSNEIIKNQPNWVYWVVWAGMVRGTPAGEYEKLAANKRVLFLEDENYFRSMQEYRQACGIDPLKPDRAADFTGDWKLNECESSSMQGAAPAGSPYKISVIQSQNNLKIKTFTVSEFSDDDITERSLTTDGSDNNSIIYGGSALIQNARWSQEKDTLSISARVRLNFGGNTNEINSNEIWSLRKRGKKLVILQITDPFMGREKQTNLMVYDRQ